jgi:hypothetical protein
MEAEVLATEDEPASIYQVEWRTMMAIIALSMSNHCAAIANTVSIEHFKEAQGNFSNPCLDKHHHQLPDLSSRGCIFCVLDCQFQPLGNPGIRTPVCKFDDPLSRFSTTKTFLL